MFFNSNVWDDLEKIEYMKPGVEITKISLISFLGLQ